jgi:3-oxoacyl-[acyl-carrier-protein] synthase-1
VALGARTPLGLTAESSVAAVRAGISRVREHPFLVDPLGAPIMTAFDGRLDPSMLGSKRLIALAASALREAVLKVTGGPDLYDLRVLVALPERRPGFSSNEAAQVLQGLQQELSNAGSRANVELAGNGHAGALRALQIAFASVFQRQSQLVVVGGVDSYLESDTLHWLAASRRLAAGDVRSGFHPGEGAGFIVIGATDILPRLGLTPLASIRGVVSTTEDRSFDKDVEVLGEGLAAAIVGAASNLRLPDETIDTVLCDINGERYRSTEWGMSVLRIQRVLRDSAYDAPADCWGDMGAAWGALGCILAVQSWQRDAHGSRTLVWGSSDGGLRGAAVLERAVG